MFNLVLPYVAPEILEGEPYTEASDIYSLGIIMTELTTGKPPYGTVPHNDDLTLTICNGLRPRVAKGTPKRYIDLVNQCLDADPQERPSNNNVLDSGLINRMLVIAIQEQSQD
ncbi:kinase-like domain-containing protein [Rhizophagus irregularis DAOM 181602=DAOM 197198]|nr:kinase-like domain-containing protein [Rhizophagus irregularis DAOM 181602=DAOM 197198]